MDNIDHDPPDAATPRNPFLVSTPDSVDSIAWSPSHPSLSHPSLSHPSLSSASSGQLVSAELIEAVRTIETKNTGGFTKLFVLFVSLGLFVAAGIAWWTPRMIAILVAVLLFHEAGHYLAMKAFGYRNVKMFFIPFLGAAVSGRHFNIAGWKKAIVYLAGPVPGIVVALPLIWFGSIREIGWMFELGGMSLFLNALNLLPLLPLDGGWIMHLTVFSRSPLLELLARVLGIGVMLAFAYFVGSRILFFFAIPLIISLPTTFRVSKLIRQMRDRPLPAPERDEIPEEAINLLNHEMQSTALSEIATPQKAALLVQIYESLIVRPPGLLATLAIWLMYGGSFLAVMIGGTTMFAMREFFWGGFFSEGMFDSTSQVVMLDASDTKFSLGNETIEASLLGVARFDSPGELNAKLNQINPAVRERFTHVRIGSVLLASVPKDPNTPLDQFATTAMEADGDELDADAFRERMNAMLRPVDPKDTWLAPILVPDQKSNRSQDAAPADTALPLPGRPVVYIISGMHHDSIRILCRAPNPQEAQRIVETDFQMLGVTADRLYIPTWSPIDPPTDQQLANRKVLQTLVNGITLESAPELFDMRNKLYQAQYKDAQYKDTQDGDDEGDSRSNEPLGVSTRVATFQAKIRALDAKYTADLIVELSGEQAELAHQYQAFQSATHQHAREIEERQLSLLKKRQELGDDFDAAQFDDDEPLYPTMDQFLDPENRLLGFGDASRPNYAFAAHVSGGVMTAEQYAREINPDALDDESPPGQWEEGQWEDTDAEAMQSEAGEFVSLYLHRATDHAATVSAIIAYLQRHGFTEFSLHYVIPTADFDE